MREVANFIGSLAGAAILSALAILVRPEAPLWKFLLWGGIGIFVACASVIIIDYFKPQGKAVLLAGLALGIALFVGCGIAFYADSTLQTGDEKLPGLAVATVLKIQDVAALRRKYVFEFGTPEGASAAFRLAGAFTRS
jgi:hypothetical protein